MRNSLKKQARITSKGQVTVPREIRRVLGVRSGDKLIFEHDGQSVTVSPLKVSSPFEKYRGIGNPGLPSGRKAILRRIREMRGR